MANDFSNDPRCIAVYRFENGALTTDSKGSNTLTASGSPTSDTSVFNEGAGSVSLNQVTPDFYHVPDASLSSNFPLKSGTTNKTISVFARIRMDTDQPSDAAMVWTKSSDSGGAGRTLTMGIANSAPMDVALRIGKSDGTFFEEIIVTGVLSLNTWYRICWSYCDTDKSYAIRIRDSSGNVVGTDTTGISGTDGLLLTSLSDMIIGARGGASPLPNINFPFDGWIDELVVFDKILTAADVTNLANGVYKGGGSDLFSGLFAGLIKGGTL